jgi:hypothetical protein
MLLHEWLVICSWKANLQLVICNCQDLPEFWACRSIASSQFAYCQLSVAHCLLSVAYCCDSFSSTRRLAALPSGVLLSATGFSWP